MDNTRQYEQCLGLVCDNLMRLLEAKLELFSEALSVWINDALSRRLPADWRDRLAAHLAEWRAQGYEMPSQHMYILEDWIEAWAYVRAKP